MPLPENRFAALIADALDLLGATFDPGAQAHVFSMPEGWAALRSAAGGRAVELALDLGRPFEGSLESVLHRRLLEHAFAMPAYAAGSAYSLSPGDGTVVAQLREPLDRFASGEQLAACLQERVQAVGDEWALICAAVIQEAPAAEVGPLGDPFGGLPPLRV